MVKNFHQLLFKSASFKKISGNKYSLVGDLTTKGVTKPIIMEVTLMGTSLTRERKSQLLGLKQHVKINRKDFGVGENLPELMVGNEVELRATGEFNKD